MKFRPASSFMTLDESMAHVREVKDWAELVAFLEKAWVQWKPKSVVTIEKWGKGVDARNGWDTHLLCVDGKAALFTDGMLEKP